MSSDDKNKKIDDTETEEDKSSQDEGEADKVNDKAKTSSDKDEGKSAVNDVKGAASTNDENTDGDGDTEEEKEVKKPAKKRPVKADDDDDDDNKEDKETEDDDEEDEEEDEKKNGVGEKEIRDRKKVDRFQEEPTGKKEVEIEVPNGKGTPFAECPRIEHFIKLKELDQLKKLHQVLYNRVGKLDKIKNNLLLFKGFDYEPESDAYIKKKQTIGKLDMKHLKEICEVLDIEKKGKKDEVVTRVMDFLCDPRDSGKAVPVAPTPRPKRTSAVKANNRGFAGLDADDSDDEMGGRGRGRSTGRRNKSKRPSYKDESSSEDEGKSKRKGGKKFSESESEPELSPSAGEEGSESDAPQKKPVKAKKAAPKKKAAGGKNAKGGSAKKAPAKRGRKKDVSESEEEKSESEDEPLQKKSKKPPTDDEIKKYVKQILEGANLEEITMKTVCKQVYGRYPDHDLTHKKDLIKTTVKSLIAS